MKTHHTSRSYPALTLSAACVFAALATQGCAPASDDPDDALVSEAQRTPARTLYTWYSPSRGDYYTTTDPAWVGAPGATRQPDYVFVRAEGQVLDPAFPEPGSRPLYSWYGAARGDAFLTTDPAWAGRAGDVRDGYGFLRLEGHVYASQVAGTVPLTLRWNGATADNYTSADPRTNALASMRPGYNSGAVQGYVIPPPSAAQFGATLADFGYDTMRVNGVRAAGNRPLLIVMVQFADQAFAPGDTCATRTARFFGPTAPTVAGYFSENSNQRFTWLNAGCVSPVTARDIVGSAQNESTFAGAMNPRLDAAGRAIGGEGTEVLGDTLTRIAGSVDLSRYDTDVDGVVETHELTIAVVYPGDGDFMNGMNRHVRSPRFVSGGRTVEYLGDVAFIGEATNFSTTVHELSHSLGTLDLYGSGFHSGGLTLMSETGATGVGDLRAWHLDPWHKIRLGWVEPRVMPITAAGSVATLEAPQTTSGTALSRSPVILYDPSRSLNEYLLVEFRNRAPSGGGRYDASMADWRGSTRGVAVWHVMTDASHTPLILPGAKIGAGLNRRIDSTVIGDDLLETANGLITPGFDRVLQSTIAVDDVYFNDRMVVVRGVTDAGSPIMRGNRGFSGLLRPEDGDYALTWNDGASAIRLRSSAVSSNGAQVSVEWSRAAQLTSRLDYSPTSYPVGAAFEVRGVLGAQQNGRIPALRSAGGLYPLTVTAWSPQRATVVVPTSVPSGRYDLVVFNPSYIGVGNAMSFDVVR